MLLMRLMWLIMLRLGQISGLVDTTTDETISLILSLFFLICSTAWVCKSTRDRADVKNKLWGEDEQLTPLILRLARGTGSNVILNVTALVSSIVLTLVCIWKSDSSEFDSTLKLLLTMGEVFQTIAAFWLSKIVRDAAIPERVTTTDWLLAGGGAVAAVGFTYVVRVTTLRVLLSLVPPSNTECFAAGIAH